MFQFLIQAGNLFQDFLQIKSGGQQISEVSPNISPTLDMRDFIYPPTSSQAGTASQGYVSATTSQKFALFGGSGIYRVRGKAHASGLTGVTAGNVEMKLECRNTATTVVAVMYLLLKYVPVSATYDTGTIMIDTLFDCRVGSTELEPSNFNVAYTEIASSDAVSLAGWNLVIQRVI